MFDAPLDRAYKRVQILSPSLVTESLAAHYKKLQQSGTPSEKENFRKLLENHILLYLIANPDTSLPEVSTLKFGG